MTYAEFKAQVKAMLFPDGEAEQLVAIHDQSILEALVDLQRYATCLQQRHEDIYAQCSTYFRVGQTVMDAPAGKVARLGVMIGDDFASKITYSPATYKEVNAWSRRFSELIEDGLPANTEHPALPLSFKYPEPTTDSIYGRAIAGMWCNESGRIYIAPWIQSSEKVLLEWDGVKTSFEDSDIVDFDATVIRAVCCYIKQDRPMDFPEGKEMIRKWIADWQAARADVIYDCEVKKRMPEDESEYADTERAVELEDETVGVEAEEELDSSTEDGGNQIVFAMVGDTHFEDSAQELKTAAVADLVKSRTIDFVVHAGDLSNTALDYEYGIGKYYGKYISPYKGEVPGFGEAEQNKFWPVIGNHDYDVNSLADYLDFFSPPITDRYYDLVKGAVHFFFLDIYGLEAAGAQYQWLVRRLALSTCPWRVVVIHKGPYASDDVHTDEELQEILDYDLNALGVDLVLSGHSHIYERIQKDRSNASDYDLIPPLLRPTSQMVCIVNGLGGGKYYGLGTIEPGSEIQYCNESGALFVTANSTTLTGEFVDVNNEIIDSFELTKSTT